jgi:hypothetical protein
MYEEVEDRLLNAEPSPPDARDFRFLGNTARGLTPPDLGPRFRQPGLGPILDQGNTGTCGGHAGIGLRQWQEKREGHSVGKFDPFRLYDECADEDGPPDPARTRGTFARTVMSVLKKTGTPTLGRGFPGTPGLAGKIASYEQVLPLTVDLIKEAIQANGVMLVRCDWDIAWMKTLPGRIVPEPAGPNGGHIFLVFGWDNAVNGGSFLMRNSWGKWFPKKGASPTIKQAGPANAYLAYRYLLAKNPEVWSSSDVLRGPLPPGVG